MSANPDDRWERDERRGADLTPPAKVGGGDEGDPEAEVEGVGGRRSSSSSASSSASSSSRSGGDGRALRPAMASLPVLSGAGRELAPTPDTRGREDDDDDGVDERADEGGWEREGGGMVVEGEGGETVVVVVVEVVVGGGGELDRRGEERERRSGEGERGGGGGERGRREGEEVAGRREGGEFGRLPTLAGVGRSLRSSSDPAVISDAEVTPLVLPSPPPSSSSSLLLLQ